MIGILMINTGTADEPTEEAVRAYLREFLSDKHLVDAPAFIWRPILEWVILRKRPKYSLPRYIDYWTPEGSPFMITSYKQAEILQEKVQKYLNDSAIVRVAMRYGNPSIRAGIEYLEQQHVERIVVVPLYPIWTIPCAGTVLDEFDVQYQRLQNQGHTLPPAIHVREYWDAPGYIDALADSIRRGWDYVPGSKFVMSYHSIPVSYVKKHGDPYPKTARVVLDAVADILGIPQNDRVIAFQSRFDNRKWIGPMLEGTLKDLALSGVCDVCVVSPIFSAECIETEHDSKRRAQAIFEASVREAGGNECSFTYVPALGTDDAFLESVAYDVAIKSGCAHDDATTLIPVHNEEVRLCAQSVCHDEKLPMGIQFNSRDAAEPMSGKGMGV